MAVSAPAFSQLSSSITRRDLHLRLSRHRHGPSILIPSLPLSRSKLSIVMSCEGGEIKGVSSSEIKSELNFSDESKPCVENKAVTCSKNAYGAAKIHDFCFGIPFGGLVLSGGFLGFLLSRKLAVLSTGVLCGGTLLALSFLSLKIWRQGKSSIPFVIGQAVVSAALTWKNFQAYSLTKKLIPTGFYAAISAAMLCFYSYVMISGGNPPPKKLQYSTD